MLLPKRHARVRIMAGSSKRPDNVHEAPPLRQPRPSESRISRIARRAHEIYEARGGEHGKALEDWLQAEREIDAEMDAATGG